MDGPDIREFLRSHGSSDADIEAASMGGWLHLLLVEQILFPGTERFTGEEVAQRAGVKFEIASRFWRAMGFPSVPEGDRIFTHSDIDALRTIVGIVEGTSELEAVLQNTRVVNVAMARVADVEVDTARTLLASADSEGDLITRLAPQLDFSKVARLVDYVHRRQLLASAWRQLTQPRGEEQALAVGFVDIVGFTALSQQLEARDLERVVATFEALVFDTVAEMGARVVKTLGDGVMFAADEPRAGALVALPIVERHEADGDLPQIRAGLAWGPTTAHAGDYFGPYVNLADRLMRIAHPGTILTSREFSEQLEGDEDFQWRLLRPKSLKGFGRVSVSVLRRAD